ncbi:hypothetical protein B0H19DRAFT_1150562 [Mycena capillaripes]|nr:hypothetical protein B0H19DRAFT_1150562 [Mycena capillaripes]
MSVKALQERIAKLATDIDLQKEVVKQLEHEKSLVQQQLNAVLDPIARLPFEISSEIFLRSIPAFQELPTQSAQPGPLLFLNICNAWTSIALSTPALWATIHIPFPCPKGFQKLLSVWLQRASHHPLSILLQMGGQLDQGVATTLWGHGRQFKHLEIRAKEDANGDVWDFLGGTTPEPLPLLETLIIRGPEFGPRIPGDHPFHLLRQAPNLVECIFDRIHFWEGHEGTAGILGFPTLHRFLLEDGMYDTLLGSLLVPALKTLSLPMGSDLDPVLLSFLKRSSPPLEELVVRASRRLDFSGLYECLCLAPTLVQFEIRVGGHSPVLLEELLGALADSAMLPNLHILTIHDSPMISYPLYLRALVARRAELRIIRIVMPDDASRPTVGIIAAFRDLVVGGMQLHIGPEDCNFISN